MSRTLGAATMALGGNGERHGVVLTRNRYFNPAWLLDNDIIKMNGIIRTDFQPREELLYQ